MAQRGANVLAALEKFKKKQKEAGKTLVRIAEERDAKRAKLASGKGQPPSQGGCEGGMGEGGGLEGGERLRRKGARAGRPPTRPLPPPAPPLAAAKPKPSKPAARPKARSAGSGDTPAGSAPSGSDWKSGKSAPRAGKPQHTPLGMRVKVVVDFLRTHGQPALPADIFTQTGV